MTHEFKTPIATINLALSAIQNPKTIINKKKVKKYLEMIYDENNRMHDQVENVLMISHLERNELNIEKSKQDLNEIIDYSSLAIDSILTTITQVYSTLQEKVSYKDKKVKITNLNWYQQAAQIVHQLPLSALGVTIEELYVLCMHHLIDEFTLEQNLQVLQQLEMLKTERELYRIIVDSVSYTHLTLPTKRIV